MLDPKWLRLLKGFDKILNKEQIRKLEDLRKKYNIPDEYYCMSVSSSTELGKIIIRRDYKDLKKTNPNMSEKEVFAFLLHHENKHMKISGSSEVMSEKTIMDAAIRINTLDDLCEFISELEKKEQPMYYTNEVCSQIESIIKNN